MITILQITHFYLEDIVDSNTPRTWTLFLRWTTGIPKDGLFLRALISAFDVHLRWMSYKHRKGLEIERGENYERELAREEILVSNPLITFFSLLRFILFL